ncbi:glycosyltransferase family protein [Polaribacter glomeratus]|uniref:Glycosyl transferase family 2 n=1 Tax=Polaribacter glomeratus TaxID=102 RepID=A0A2S7WHV8_9FLAO|nr:glycosyltransferase family 2 protein [Polaribacter glomeratus]PQJ77193.1 glycosyl transferase family 2 [Polaribacter glomeratus]TXD65157.1 glycosyltransferase family 2 protein [Polaribacter glomeratus]
MKEKLDISASIVLYNENLEELTSTINAFLSVPLKKKLYLVDNTKSKLFQHLFKQKEIEYIAIGKNIGFGAGHNIVIDRIKNNSNFHLILNPDVNFEKTVIPNLILQLNKDDNLSMIAPKVLFPNGEHQYSCRRYPLLLELIVRRFPVFMSLFNPTISRGQYKDRNLTSAFFAEYLTGCFQLYKTADFVALEGFDERYFLYMEDVDICRKIDQLGKKKLYYPQEVIYHVLKQGSAKDLNLFLRHTSSAIKYFLKWGF